MSMSAATFTPGPWTTTQERDDSLVFQVRGASGELVASVAELTSTAPHNEASESEANARLIAAAPELLEALKGMTDLMDKLWKAVPWGQTFNLPVQELNEAPILAKRAIAKAEGSAD